MLSQIISLLKYIGLTDKEIAVYEVILPLGSASVRTIAEKTTINRGTVHDILEGLTAKGLVGYERHAGKRKFIVESPEKVLQALEAKEKEIFSQKKRIEKAMPTLLSFYAKQGGRPSVEYFDDDRGIKRILEDVLTHTAVLPDKTYYAYSSRSVRKYLYRLFPHFTKEKIKKGIRTLVIALGEGGDPVNLKLAERKWIKRDAPAYILVYGPKIALISVAEDKHPFGVIINDEKIAETQRIIFKELWSKIQ